jgi:hypothetical protein
MIACPGEIEFIDWINFGIELLRRLDRIADELQKIGDRIAELPDGTPRPD